jgi:hypothetical protein
MTKKIFALVMVVSILGAFLAGCKKDDAADTTGGTAGTAGKTDTTGTTGDAPKTTS